MSTPKIEQGFSIIELLLVVVIVGILATIGVPSYTKAREAAEKSGTIGMLRTIHTYQTTYLVEKKRYARLNELNAFFGNTLGRTSGNRIIRGNYSYQMSPTPTLTTLQTRYQVIVYKITPQGNIPQYSVKQDGLISAIAP